MIKYAILLSIFFSLHLHAQNTDHGCSVWRRDVKILADLDQARIDALVSSTPKQVTVKALTDEAPQIDGKEEELTNNAKWENVKRQPSESYTVMVVAKVVACGKEANDRDYHIVLEDVNSGAQMVAEIPDPDCPDITNASLKRRFNALRTWFDNNVQVPGEGVKPLPTPIIITLVGIPFWDGKHGEAVHGAAANFREIHPILKFVTQAGQEIPFIN